MCTKRCSAFSSAFAESAWPWGDNAKFSPVHFGVKNRRILDVTTNRKNKALSYSHCSEGTDRLERETKSWRLWLDVTQIWAKIKRSNLSFPVCCCREKALAGCFSSRCVCVCVDVIYAAARYCSRCATQEIFQRFLRELLLRSTCTYFQPAAPPDFADRRCQRGDAPLRYAQTCTFCSSSSSRRHRVLSLHDLSWDGLELFCCGAANQRQTTSVLFMAGFVAWPSMQSLLRVTCCELLRQRFSQTALYLHKLRSWGFFFKKYV